MSAGAALPVPLSNDPVSFSIPHPFPFIDDPKAYIDTASNWPWLSWSLQLPSPRDGKELRLLSSWPSTPSWNQGASPSPVQ